MMLLNNSKILRTLQISIIMKRFWSEWHFFVTAHGKDSCDGIDGTVKRMAHASFQRSSDY